MRGVFLFGGLTVGTKLRNVPNVVREISQKRSWGGQSYGGETVQITMSNPQYQSGDDDMFQYIRVTREEAKALAIELMLFGESVEVEYV
tara:strand:- start:266 stop:532 length:267 start_codon:yes stop_codon:yes gene_type:complete